MGPDANYSFSDDPYSSVEQRLVIVLVSAGKKLASSQPLIIR